MMLHRILKKALMAVDNIFSQAVRCQNSGTPPIWMMRQAGRYHKHYQALRRKHGFVDLCKNSDLAAEVALGPVNEFDFDAAILFSDILFPIEVMGPDLIFDPGPKFSYHLRSKQDLLRYSVPSNALDLLFFQAQALQKTRARLNPQKDLISFIGGPLTLYVFAVHGSHKANLDDARAGLHDGRFEGFMDRLIPLLLENLKLQAQAGCDAVSIFESCAGDISFDHYRDLYFPHLLKLISGFRDFYPDTPIIYYAKAATLSHWDLISALPINVFGVDHDQNMSDVFFKFGHKFSVQGNFDPTNLTLPNDLFRQRLKSYLEMMVHVPAQLRKGWICGLGHGVTPQAREENVYDFVRLVRNFFQPERIAS